ncbi:MAG: flagellar hook-length control protein FliK [Lutisporaceae bacterium]|jgi:ElaB/YqjD/DUF883 family membrane-anchored ribosome-binding protein
MRIVDAVYLNIRPEVLELLKNLEIGDVLKGRVLEVLANNISVRTSSGQVFTAILQEGGPVPKGALVELLINNIADGKIYAELKTESKAADMDAKVADLLKQLGFPVNEKNMEAARLLIKYKLPLNKETISNITGLQKSIDNLNNSTEEKIGLMLSGLNIKDTPIDVLNKHVLNWPSDITAFEAIPENDGRKPEAPEAAIIKQIAAGTVSEGKGTENPGKAADIPRTDGNETYREAARQVSPVKKLDELERVLIGMGLEAGEEVRQLAAKVENILASISNVDMEAITYLTAKEMKITPGNLSMLLKNIENRDGISQFLDKLQERIEGKKSPELMEIKAHIRRVFLEPRQLKEGKDVSDQLKDIAKLGEKLESYLNKSGDKDPEIKEALSNLKDSIDFIRNINQHSNYLQLPLMINGDTSTAKLYVFKEDKRNKQINPEDATVVIVLDLANLGHLESMIRVKGKSVSLTFRVENKNIGAILRKNGDSLKKSLNEKGYSLNPIRIIGMEQPFSLLSMEAMINESAWDKIHFDVRV